MSSYLTIYGVPKRKPTDEKEPLPVMLLCYSRSHPIYQAIYEELNPAYCGNDDENGPMSYSVLTPDDMDKVIEAQQREIIDTNEKLNMWHERLFHAMRGRKVVLDDEGDEVEYDFNPEEPAVAPEDSKVNLHNRGFEIINEWINTYTECLCEYRETLDYLHVVATLVRDATSDYGGEGKWYERFEKIICNID